MKIRQIYILILILIPINCHASDWSYTFRPGDSLWDLSNKYLISTEYYTELQALNKISDPTKILPGTIIKIPIKWLKKQPSSALITDTYGAVTIIRSSENKIIMNSLPDNRIYAGDRIVTGKDSSATLVLADQSRLIIYAESEIIMDSISQYGDTGMVDTTLRLPAGRIDNHVNPNKSPGSRYKINTPAAVAAVRGTEFRMSADSQRNISRSEVLTGLIGVLAQDNETEVPEGYGNVTKIGEQPQKPRELLKPPVTTSTRTNIIKFPAELNWSVLDGAKVYRTQILPTNKQDRIIYDRLNDKASLRLNELKDGRYILRIRGIDDIGLEGYNANHEFVVQTIPVITELMTSASGSALNNATPEFRWKKDERADRYHFQIAYDQNFTKIIEEKKDLKTNYLTPENVLPDQVLYWRVAGINTENVRGRFSPVSKIVIKTRTEPVLVYPAFVDYFYIYYRWRPITNAASYVIQVSPVHPSNKIYWEYTVKQPFIRMMRPASGVYYYRVGVSKRKETYSEWKRLNIPYLH